MTNFERFDLVILDALDLANSWKINYDQRLKAKPQTDQCVFANKFAQTVSCWFCERTRGIAPTTLPFALFQLSFNSFKNRADIF